MARPNELRRNEALGDERPREMVIAHAGGNRIRLTGVLRRNRWGGRRVVAK